jgi:hypothetical protein
VEVVYAYETPEGDLSQSIFLAGPSPREEHHPNWRPQALKILEGLGFEGTVFVPLPRDGVWSQDYGEQVEWELEYLGEASRIVFWIPRDLEMLPGFTTNVEFGMYASSEKVVLGFPKGTPHMRYLAYLAGRNEVPVFNTLEEAIGETIKALAEECVCVCGHDYWAHDREPDWDSMVRMCEWCECPEYEGKTPF